MSSGIGKSKNNNILILSENGAFLGQRSINLFIELFFSCVVYKNNVISFFEGSGHFEESLISGGISSPVQY